MEHHFIIRTDHKSLWDLLSQALQTQYQQHYLQKLLGYQFTIEYKYGLEISVVDALSRRHKQHDAQFGAAISMGNFDFLEELCSDNETYGDLQNLRKRIA